MLDLIGLGLIVPYITLVDQPDSIMEKDDKGNIILFDLSYDQDKLLFWLSLFLVSYFLAKTIAVLSVNNLIILFVQQSMVRFRSNLMKIYQQLPTQFIYKEIQQNMFTLYKPLQEIFMGGATKSFENNK